MSNKFVISKKIRQFTTNGKELLETLFYSIQCGCHRPLQNTVGSTFLNNIILNILQKKINK
jgi:hypothetical protein